MTAQIKAKALVATCQRCGKLKIRVYRREGLETKRVLEQNKGMCECA